MKHIFNKNVLAVMGLISAGVPVYSTGSKLGHCQY